MSKRYIALIDLDTFYVSVHRQLDPSLANVPLGISQKSLLATCCHDARRLGVRKLMPVHEAMRVCPTLVVVNGEDLAPFRKASAEVRDVVREIIGQFEAVGLDEVWVDLTEFVSAALSELDSAESSSSIAVTNYDMISIKKPSVSLLNNHSVQINSTSDLTQICHEVSSNVPAITNVRSSLTRSRSDNIALNIIQYISATIFSRTCYTTSTGIAPNKTLSKLLASMHKPNQCTIWVGPSTPEHTQAFLSPLPLGQLRQWGSSCCARISAHFALEREIVTVGEIIARLQPEDLTRVFGPRLAKQLDEILRGTETDPVVPTPKFPRSISSEDSFARNTTFTLDRMHFQVRRLTEQLVARVENELCLCGKWERYPLSCRLSIHLMSGKGRISQGKKVPAEFFHKKRTSLDRVEILVKIFNSMNNLLDQGEKSHEIYVINVAVTNLSETAPGNSIAEAIALTPKQRPKRKRNHGDGLIVTIDSSSEAEVWSAPRPKLISRKTDDGKVVVIDSSSDCDAGIEISETSTRQSVVKITSTDGHG